MLRALKTFFDQHLAPQTGETNASHRLHLAAAALMIEMMKVDDEIDERERETILRALQVKFGLAAHETRELFELASAEAAQATDYYQFTALINQNFGYEQRVTLIEFLWEIAYADGSADMHEEHLVRKIAELIYVAHSDFIAAKQKVLSTR